MLPKEMLDFRLLIVDCRLGTSIYNQQSKIKNPPIQTQFSPGKLLIITQSETGEIGEAKRILYCRM